jgi:hypothetical protein
VDNRELRGSERRHTREIFGFLGDSRGENLASVGED